MLSSHLIVKSKEEELLKRKVTPIFPLIQPDINIRNIVKYVIMYRQILKYVLLKITIKINYVLSSNTLSTIIQIN